MPPGAVSDTERRYQPPLDGVAPVLGRRVLPALRALRDLLHREHRAVLVDDP